MERAKAYARMQVWERLTSSLFVSHRLGVAVPCTHAHTTSLCIRADHRFPSFDPVVHLRPSPSVPGHRLRYEGMSMSVFVGLFEPRRGARLLQPVKKASVKKGQQLLKALRFFERQQLRVQAQIEAKETTGKRKKALDDVADDDQPLKQPAAKRRKSRESDSPPPQPPSPPFGKPQPVAVDVDVLIIRS
ncbi:hypothetical protein IW262DRAFT_1466720 [Armillaria fumosa]|nr:hypothetical protein IW262DRAFT_1466720 [Armillaria fumosa]